MKDIERAQLVAGLKLLGDVGFILGEVGRGHEQNAYISSRVRDAEKALRYVKRLLGEIAQELRHPEGI